MARDMRRLLTFACEGALLGAALDGADGRTGLIFVTGGSQTRVGSHRMFERLAKSLSKQGIACLRYDRRGVGDSEGEDPGFRGSAADLGAAAARHRAEIPGLQRVYGFGLCDGATTIALFGDGARLDGLILVNPWLVEAASGEPPPAAIRRHYRERLLSVAGWQKILSGAVDYRKLLSGIRKISRRGPASSLAADVAAALDRHRLPVQLILAAGDATAIAAESEMKSPAFKGLAGTAQKIDSDSHTFARSGDEAALLGAVLEAVRRLENG
jgi:exosortase A-associated hydrolase 1